MSNGRIAEVFEDIGGLLEMKGEQAFTIRAYQRVAEPSNTCPQSWSR